VKVAFLKSAYRESDYPPPNKPEIAFAGRSNVGKSSLINTLLNRKQIARTSSKPGRTQAINFFSVDDSLYFVDLPGYGYARVPLHVRKSWGGLVNAYLRGRSSLKAVVVILDIRRDPGSDDLDLMAWLDQHHITCVPVLTKSDKLSRQRAILRQNLIDKQLSGVCRLRPVLFSARTKQGREEVWKTIREAIQSVGYQGHRP